DRWWNLLDTATHNEVRERTGIHCSTLFDNARGIYPDNNGPITYGPNDRVGKRMSAAEVDRWLVERRQRVPIERQPEIDALFEELKARVVERFGDMKFIVWSNDKKSTLLANAVPATANAPKAPKEQKITKRRLMVPGARWTFTKEVEVHIWMDNPEIDRLTKERDSYRVDRNSRHMQGGSMVIVLGGGREQTQGELDAMARIQKQIDATDKQVRVLAAKIPAGCRVEVTKKPEASSHYNYDDRESNGLMVALRVIADGPIKVAGQFLKGDRWHNPLWAANGVALPYSQIEAAMEIEADSVPEEIVWTLRDSVTGEYFGGWLFEKDRYGHNRSTDKPKLSATFSGAKKYKNLSAVKASIMDFTGYHAGIEDEGYKAEWVGNSDKKIDLPPTWEAVAVDKTTNGVKRTEDVQKWFASLMRLRVLTVQFGSAVRTLYKKIEGKEGYEAIVVFKTPERWEDLDDRDKRLINEAMEACADAKPPSVKNDGAQAFAVTSQIDATLIMLAYQGTGECKAFDVANLQEIVPEKAS
ncbi:MAG: hypothetical protein DI537_49685, partial [Stutzerimonas stutzeri]